MLKQENRDMNNTMPQNLLCCGIKSREASDEIWLSKGLKQFPLDAI